MSKYQSRADLSEKIDYEGGIYEALNYGLYPEDMPDQETAEELTKLLALWEPTQEAAKVFLELVGW